MRIPSILAAALTAALVPTTALAAPSQRSAPPYARDLAVTVAAPDPAAPPGATVPFTVVVCNHGTETPQTPATLVVNGPPDEGMQLSSDSVEATGGGWNWIRLPVAQGLRPNQCSYLKLRSRTVSTLPGPRSYPGGTAEVSWDGEQNPADNLATWTSEISAPVTGAYLALARPPLPTAPGDPADFEVEERNLGPSTDYPWRGRLVAQLPPGSTFLSSAPDSSPCAYSDDATTAVCPDGVGNTWAWLNRGFAVRISPTAPHGGTVTATLTYEAPADPAPHAFVLKVDIPVR
ncbi:MULTISPECIES: hypothetical protein [Kitasatospora]|uniref:DUF11 domain-containing protein n=1 Tax=Kitasatospora setae (strain ATCC 33774 / DSM 43861 / JCM 3304 / KCC A-0304 / NBRC 14216 / KM-6054) TaxID=452652 RepID=E4N5P8_KITSK|nr:MULTISPECIES: hypothetical protein [Kitasatospora]BAJ26529.1 hypothetical protein KSE_06890 [Kitasatospora setae KM-6054]